MKKIEKIIEEKCYFDKRDGDHFEFEVFCNYDDELSKEELTKISRAQDPRTEFEDMMSEWCINAEDYYYPELYKTITSELEDYDENEVREWIDEHCSWYMPKEHFNKNAKVVVSLDVGDMNYDFTKCNMLNFYGGEFEEISPIYWLAKQQGKLEEVKRIIELEQEGEVNSYKDDEFSKFTLSVRDELLNATSHMNTLIFCVQMPLFDFFKLKELIKADEKANDDYEYDKRKGENKFIVTKNAMCGLYDIWGGGGSTLEIELENDVVISTKDIFDVWIDCSEANGRGYDVSDVYGFSSAAFSGSVKFEEEEK